MSFGPRLMHVALGDALQDGTMAAPGDGEINFGAVFDALEAVGWRSDVAVECNLVNEDNDGRRAAVARARDHLFPLLREER